MSQIRIYLDEDSLDQSLLRALRVRQIDVVTVQDTNSFGEQILNSSALPLNKIEFSTVITLKTFINFILSS